MAKLPSAFREEDHGDMGTFPTIPEADYHLLIVGSEYKETKKKDGHQLVIEFKVVSGDHAGAKLWSRLNLDNPSKQAVDLANKELATILRAVGKVVIEDSEELHGLELTGRVKLEKGTGDNPDQNRIKNYFPLEGAENPSKSEGEADAPAGGTKRRPVFEDDDD